MKRKIALASLLTFSILFNTVSALAYTENRVVGNVKVGTETEFITNAPELVIYDKNGDLEDNFSITLSLNNAIWLYEEGDVISSSPELEVVTVTKDLINISVKNYLSSGTDEIRIPLKTKCEDPGDLTVTVNSGSGAASEGTYVFGQYVGDIGLSITAESDLILYGEDNIGDILIKDSSTGVVEAGKVYEISLSNGFEFVSASVSFGGKYSDAATFSIDSTNRSKAKIKITKATSATSGQIELKDVDIKKSGASEPGSVYLKLKVSTGETDIKIGTYKRFSDFYGAIKINEIDTSTSQPAISGTATKDRKVAVNIDGIEIGTSTVDSDGNWKVDYPNYLKELENREHALAVYYVDENNGEYVSGISAETVFTTKKEAEKQPDSIYIKVGEKSYMKNGVKYDLDVPAYIDSNSRTMLPLRAIANVLGIPDNNIKWDGENRVVSITSTSKTIYVTIDSNQILVNGVPVTIDTKAVIVDGRTFIPLRAVVESFGLSNENITWDDASKSVTITVPSN